MAQLPTATFHASEVDLHLTSDGSTAMLVLANDLRGFAVTMPRTVLDELHARTTEALAEKRKAKKRG
ncbi:MAG TPA: hypothetical protein VKV77_07510 [Methylovirgula sp.]|nr:hypothetical protein [Methylovirgula sp.]